MKLFTSYFYKIRFFKPWQVPVSTALSDPRWYHDFRDKDHKFIDKNNVLNGIRAEFLHPDRSCEGLCHGHDGCKFSPESCQFLNAYRKQLLSLDKDYAMQKLQALADKIQLFTKHEAEIVLIVHEAPYNPCSERCILQEVFNCKELEV